MKKQFLLSLAASSFLLTGCVFSIDSGEHGERYSKSSWEVRHADNRDAIAQLDTGSSYASVLAEMGTPDFSEHLSVNQKNYQILFYATQSLHSDSKTSKDECTPLLFEEKRLVSWGETAYQQLKTR